MIIAVGSVKGSPGATTAALALADRWPVGNVPLVVEADPAGGDLGARFGLAAARGLVTLAAAGRRGDRVSDGRSLTEHVHELPGGLPVVTAPAGAEQARQVLGELAGGGWSLLWGAARRGRTMIVDCGRLDPLSPAAPAWRAADALLVVLRARDDEIGHLAARWQVLDSWGLPAWYLLPTQVDGSRERRMRDLVRILGPQVLGPLPYDLAAAQVLAGRRRQRRGIRRSALGRAAGGVAGFLTSGAVPARSDAELPPGRTAAGQAAALSPGAGSR